MALGLKSNFEPFSLSEGPKSTVLETMFSMFSTLVLVRLSWRISESQASSK